MADGGASLELAEYSTDFTKVMRRRWAVVLAGPLAGVFLAVAALHVITPGYTSTASVIVLATGDETTIANGRTSNPINLDTEAQIVTSAVVAKIAQQHLHSTEEPRELAHHVTITVPPNTSVLDISFTASSPAAAQRGADAFAEAYLENRRSAAQAHLDGTVNSLEKRVAALNGDLRTLSDQIAALPVNSPARAYKAARRNLLVQQIAGLNNQQVALISGDFQAGKIITDAQLPKVPSSPSKKLILASGLLAGLLVGLIAGFVLDRRDHRIRSRADVQRIGIPVLGRELALPPATARRRVLLAPQGEEVRRLRIALMAGLPDRRGAIVIAGVSSDSTGSSLAACLAVNAARTGARVVLLLANLTDPVMDKSLGLENRAGLAEVVQLGAKLDNVVIPVAEVPNLAVLPSGGLASAGRRAALSEVLQGGVIAAVVADLRDRYDVVIIDAAPTTMTADAETLATMADGVLLVVTANQSTREEVVEAVDDLDQMSVTMLGAAVASTKSMRGSRKGEKSTSGSSGKGRVTAGQGEDLSSRLSDRRLLVDASQRSERRRSERRLLRRPIASDGV